MKPGGPGPWLAWRAGGQYDSGQPSTGQGWPALAISHRPWLSHTDHLIPTLKVGLGGVETLLISPGLLWQLNIAYYDTDTDTDTDK